MDAKQPIRIMIVEDHTVVRLGLKALLRQNSHFLIVGDVGSCQETLANMEHWNPDIILMDLRLPDGTGVELCREVLKENPQMKILFLTSHGDDESMFSAVMAGASGYLLKEIGPERLTQAIELVSEGHSILDQQTIQRVKNWIEGQSSIRSTAKDVGFSPQQRRIIALVVQGKTNKEIALEIGLSDKTVRNYLSTVFEKLQVSRRSQIAGMFSGQFRNETSQMTPS